MSVDNILERLLALPAPESGETLKVTRVGHPARVMAQEDVIDATLEVKASRSDQVGGPSETLVDGSDCLGRLCWPKM